LALVVSPLGLTILKFTPLKDNSEWVVPAAGVAAVAAGPALGAGLALAGGRGPGSPWRGRGGQVGVVIGPSGFAPGPSVARFGAGTGLRQELGAAVFLRASLGWGGAIALGVAIALAWARLSTWNEETHTLSVV